MNDAQVREKLASIGQSSVLRFADSIGSEGTRKLLEQLETLDLDAVAELAETQVRQKRALPLPRDIQPIPAYPRTPRNDQVQLYADAEARGHELLKEGKVAAFLVAGGQGTRLGFDGPKGAFPVTPIKNKPLFQVFAEQLLAHSRDAGRVIPWYVMTSDTNAAATRAFFRDNDHFGYDARAIFFFQQGMMPAFAMDGSLLLAEKDSLTFSPDGHGGSLRALARSGALADMVRRGVEHLSYFQVDNPLVHCIDPLFLGLHDLTGSEMSSKIVSKAHALERVGNVVLADGVVQVIEYSDLPESLATQRNPDGSLRFDAGSIAVHALRVSFVQRLNQGGTLTLPWHRAEKKVPAVDDSGRVVTPDRPNAVKLEQFVFDAIPLAKNAMVYTTERGEEFSPVKNADGPDSPGTSRRDQIKRATRWLASAGFEVPLVNGEPACTVEISPLLATSAAQLEARALRLAPLSHGQSLYLE